MATIAEYLVQRRSDSPDYYLAKIQILDSEENIIEEITDDLLDGSVNVVLQNGSRRSASITLRNTDGEYNLNPTGKIWLDTKFRLFSGIKINGTDEYYSQGIFVLGEPSESSQISSATVTYQLYDKFSLLNNTLSGQLLNSIIVANGTNIVTAIGNILTAANANQPLLNYTKKPLIADASTVAISYTLRIDEGGTYQDVLIKLAESINREIYFDIDGFPNLSPPTDYDNEPSVCSLTEDDKIKIGSVKNYDLSQVRNSVRVVGGDFGTGEVFDATVQDTNVLSQTRVARIGQRELYIYDDIISSDALALTRAEYELSKAIQLFESINIEVIPIDFLDVGDMIDITDARLGLTNERYLVRQLTIPLIHNGNSLPMDCWKSRSFS